MNEAAPSSGRQFFTVGHSTLDLEEFIGMLREAGVGLVVDVRRLPGSKRYPWFDAEPLEAALREAGIGYRRAAGLTGRRPKSKDVDPSVNAFWQNQSFHNYADHAQSEEFADALAELQADGDARPAIMCAEAVWWRCHRRLIADALLARGENVVHLMGPGKSDPAKLTPGAQVNDGRVTYPAK